MSAPAAAPDDEEAPGIAVYRAYASECLAHQVGLELFFGEEGPPIEKYDAGPKGWGLKATRFIERGTPITMYPWDCVEFSTQTSTDGTLSKEFENYRVYLEAMFPDEAHRRDLRVVSIISDPRNAFDPYKAAHFANDASHPAAVAGLASSDPNRVKTAARLYMQTALDKSNCSLLVTKSRCLLLLANEDIPQGTPLEWFYGLTAFCKHRIANSNYNTHDERVAQYSPAALQLDAELAAIEEEFFETHPRSKQVAAVRR